MKRISRPLILGAVISSILMVSPVFAETDKPMKMDVPHEAGERALHHSGSSSMGSSSMMGHHQAMQAMMQGMKHGSHSGSSSMGSSSMMGHHQAMHAMMQGKKHGGKAGCSMATSVERDFSSDDVRKILEAQLVWRGNKRLKVGKIEKQDDDTFVAEIVTVDDSLVERIEVNRTTGALRAIN